MKPQNKHQKRVVELLKELPDITEEQEKWGIEYCMDKFIHYSKHLMTCMECGQKMSHSYSEMPKEVVCPKCGTKCKTKETKCHSHKERAYYGVIDTFKEFQLVRIFTLDKFCKTGYKSEVVCWEVMQHWITEGKQPVFIARQVQGLGMYYDQWVYGSLLEVRGTKGYKASSRYRTIPYKFYPGMKILKEVIRNGFMRSFHGIAPQFLFQEILNDRMMETLIKTKQIALLKYSVDEDYYKRNIIEAWPSVKICIRHKYIIKDASIWLDHLNLLAYFKRDLRNPKYICPEDLHKEHDRLVKKKKYIERKKKIAELKAQMEKDQILFEERRKQFFGLQFISGHIVVQPLKTVAEFMEEGDKLGHCLFTNKYYDLNDSLILSARVNGEPVETVEVSLSNLKIQQARGAGNKATKFHKRIVALVNDNMSEIAKRARINHKKEMEAA